MSFNPCCKLNGQWFVFMVNGLMVKPNQWSCKQTCRLNSKWVATTIGSVNNLVTSGGGSKWVGW